MAALKNLCLLLSITILTAGCSLLAVSHFDSNEQSVLTTIVQVSQDKRVCANAGAVIIAVKGLNTQAEWLKIYGTPIPNNGPMQVMALQLWQATNELQIRYAQASPPGRVYCELKLDNVHKLADIMHGVSARRPR